MAGLQRAIDIDAEAFRAAVLEDTRCDAVCVGGYGDAVAVSFDGDIVAVSLNAEGVGVGRNGEGVAVSGYGDPVDVVREGDAVLVGHHGAVAVCVAAGGLRLAVVVDHVDAGGTGVGGGAAAPLGGGGGAPAAVGGAAGPAPAVGGGEGGARAGAGDHAGVLVGCGLDGLGGALGGLGVGPETPHPHLHQHLVDNPHLGRDDEVHDRAVLAVAVGLQGLGVNLGSALGVGLLNAQAVGQIGHGGGDAGLPVGHGDGGLLHIVIVPVDFGDIGVRLLPQLGEEDPHPLPHSGPVEVRPADLLEPDGVGHQGLLQLVQQGLGGGLQTFRVLIPPVDPRPLDDAVLAGDGAGALQVGHAAVDGLNAQLVDALAVALGIQACDNLLRVAVLLEAGHVVPAPDVELRQARGVQPLEAQPPGVDGGVGPPDVLPRQGRGHGEQGGQQALLLPTVLKLVAVVALIQHPVFHQLVIEDVPDHVRRAGAQVPHHVAAKEDVVNEGGQHVLALVGRAAGLVHGQGGGHNPVELPVPAADVVEGLAVLVFRVIAGQGEAEVPQGVDPLLLRDGAGVLQDGHPPPCGPVKNFDHRNLSV